MSKTLTISSSMASRVATCSTKAWLAAKGWKPIGVKNGRMEIGKISHEVFNVLLGYFFDGTDWVERRNQLESEGALDDEVTGQPDPAFSEGNLNKVWEEFFERNRKDKVPFNLNTVEIEFTKELGSIHVGGEVITVKVSGVRDGDATRNDGAPITIEHKTTRRNIDARFIRKFWMDAQNSCYWWSREGEVPEVVGTYVNAVQIKKLPDSNRRCTEHGVPYKECGKLHMQSGMYFVDRSPQDIEVWKRDMLTLARKFYSIIQIEDVRDVAQEGKFNGSCENCEYYKFCRAGKPQDISMFLEYEQRQGGVKSGLKSELGDEA